MKEELVVEREKSAKLSLVVRMHEEVSRSLQVGGGGREGGGEGGWGGGWGVWRGNVLTPCVSVL